MTWDALRLLWRHCNVIDYIVVNYLEYAISNTENSRVVMMPTFSSPVAKGAHRVLLTPVHDDVIKWEHFPRNWPFVQGIHRSPANSPHKGQWRGALMFSLICVWINGWVNNRKAGDLRRYRAHYDVIVMWRCDRMSDSTAIFRQAGLAEVTDRIRNQVLVNRLTATSSKITKISWWEMLVNYQWNWCWLSWQISCLTFTCKHVQAASGK